MAVHLSDRSAVPSCVALLGIAAGVMLTIYAAGCSSDSSPSSPSTGTGGSAGASGRGGNAGTVAMGGAQAGTGGAQGSGGDLPRPMGAGGAPDPSVVVTEAAGIGDMQIDQTYLYWVEGSSTILRMPLAGGSPSAVVSAPGASGEKITHMAIDASRIYWTESLSPGSSRMGSVYARAIDGSGSSMALATTTSPDRISVDGGSVYFTTSIGDVDRVPTTGGQVTTLVHGSDTRSTIVATGGFVYFIIRATDFIENLFRVPGNANVEPSGGQGDAGAGVDGGIGGAVSQVSMNGSISTLVLSSRADVGSLYWAVFDDLFTSAGSGMQVELGRVSEPLTPKVGGSVDALYPYKGDVYWLSLGFAGAAGDLWKFTPGGEVRKHLANGYIGAFVVNDTSVYFADGQRIRRVER